MNSKEIEEGGAWYEARLELEEIARAIGADSLKVIPFDQYQGPCGLVSYKGLEARIWLEADDKYHLAHEHRDLSVSFYKEEASEELWTKLNY